jgi:putative DNA primase/helicase
MDPLAPFLAERCIVDPGASEPSISLYKAYREWAEQNGERPVTQRKFGQRLAEHGFILDRAGRCRFWTGIRLRAQSEEDGNGA